MKIALVNGPDCGHTGESLLLCYRMVEVLL